MRVSYYCYLFFAVATIYNMFAVVVATFGIHWTHGPTLFQLMVAFVYLLTSIPGAWMLWHMRLYKNLMKNSATGVRLCLAQISLSIPLLTNPPPTSSSLP